MSKKIIFDQQLKEEMIKFIKETYQCKLSDISEKFDVSKHSIVTNFGSEFLKANLFSGVKDSTKKKLRSANLGKKQSEETKEKRKISCCAAAGRRSKEEKTAAHEKAVETKIKKYGSWEEYTKHQVAKSKETKKDRYGDANYNNQAKNKATKLARYGNENYNNQSKIKNTQFAKYGGYAFNDFEKVHKTNLLRYGVEHNWSSPEHDGHATKYAKYGGKENYYKHLQEKSRDTRLMLYGDEFYSNSEQAQQTMLEKYGYTSYMFTEDFCVKRKSTETRQKAINTRRKNGTFNSSMPEKIVAELLIAKFGIDDVLKEYQDLRYADPVTGYMFKCDFYIKSLDLFIELNYHPTHYLHAFDKEAPKDEEIMEKLINNPTPWNKACLDIWTNKDPLKYEVAKSHGLKYLVLYPCHPFTNIISYIEEAFK